MGIVGLWRLLRGDDDSSTKTIKDDHLLTDKRVVYVDALYLSIRIATAMSSVPIKDRDTVSINVIISRRSKILAIPASEYILVFDGAGSSSEKIPRRTPPGDIGGIINHLLTIFSGIFTIISLPPGVEADDYIISNATPIDIIVSDDSDMLSSTAAVYRFDGRVYTRRSVLRDLSEKVGWSVSDDDFMAAISMTRNDKVSTMDAPTFLSALKSLRR
jgi:hypothetical protein